MKTLIVYDSVYGNTEKIAKAIGESIGTEASMVPVASANISQLEFIELLVVGSPVHGGRPTPAIEEFLKSIPSGSLSHKKVAAFDTRFAAEDHGIGLRILMNVIRYAAERIGKQLTQKGGTLLAKPEGFIVADKNGPLKKGELTRAQKWLQET